MISAETGSGVDRLKRDLATLMPPGPWLYPEDQIADAPMRALAAEITREKIFETAARRIALSDDRRNRVVEGPARRLGAHRADDLRDAREPQEDRHRRGRPHAQGDRLRGAAARSPRPTKRKVHLFLFVKVREDWLDDPGALSGDGAGVSEGVISLAGRPGRDRPSGGDFREIRGACPLRRPVPRRFCRAIYHFARETAPRDHSSLCNPRIDDRKTTIGKPADISGSNGCSTGKRNGGDQGVKTLDRPGDPPARQHDLGVAGGGRGAE